MFHFFFFFYSKNMQYFSILAKNRTKREKQMAVSKDSAYTFSFLLCLLFICIPLPAQSTAMEIETLLDTQAVSYGQAARFVLEASDTLVTASPEEAFNYAVRQGWLPADSAFNDNARLDRISLLLMRSFEMSGGIFYSLTKNAHYAYLELVYNNVITGRHDPAMPVSGARLLLYVSRILAMQGEMAGGQICKARSQ
jgi:hypothetical protein